jgi:hypothetical protein
LSLKTKKEENKMMRITTKLSFLALVVVALTFAFGHSAMALHKADTLKCMACHTMHASENGDAGGVTPDNGFAAAPDDGVNDGGNPRLLLQANVTDLCLACHSQGGSASDFVDDDGISPPWVMSTGTQTIALPGGDYWSSTQQHPGDDGVGGRGHNPSGGSPVLLPDTNLSPLRPPGLDHDIAKWDCGACHAPHHGDISSTYGTASPFRMLWGKPAGEDVNGDLEFVAEGGDLTQPESDANHTAYQDNTSGWCGQCHGTFHSDAGNGRIHPSDEGLGGSNIYALYNGNPSPDPAGRYSFLVPFELTTIGPADDISATTTSLVTCLTCHRAHGAATSSALAPEEDYPNQYRHTRNITRWDNEGASGSGTGCNKCHSKGGD